MNIEYRKRNTKYTYGIFQVVLLVSGLLLTGCRSSKVPVGPPLSRVAEWNENPEYLHNTEDVLLTWLNTDTPTVINHTPESRWRNGFAGCMDPFMVDWAQSDIREGQTGTVVLHNVQVAGNPVLGTSINASVHIPPHSIERVEFVVVRYALKGLAKMAGHVQLRFVFRPDSRPQLFDAQGNPDAAQPYLDDLVVSWEAWRASNTPWQFVAGLDPANYALTARMYSGNQRFLNDSLRGAIWDCYPLLLPDSPNAEDKILYCCLMLGDIMTRKTFSGMIKDQLIKKKGEDFTRDWTKEQRERALNRLSWDGIPDNWLKHRMQDADLSYNSIERSCITVALFQIELAMAWLYKEEDLGSRREIAYAPPGDLPVWFNDLVTGEKTGGFFAAPRAIFWALNHKEIFPYKAYLPLEKAGMLQTDKKGKTIMYRYDLKNGSPYGELRRNLM
jgi:hypothetical protein